MSVTIGTFNLNNLFSRFDFEGVAEGATPGDPTATIESQTKFTFDQPGSFVLREFKGKLVKGKPDAERAKLVERIKRMDLNVLAVQEVEDINTLKRFNLDDLGGQYDDVVLIEGNDPRLIDVGVLSNLPIGRVTSWQHIPDPQPDVAGERLFSRDLLEVQILERGSREPLLTLFVNHLKSRLVPFGADPAVETPKNNHKRQRQATGAAEIIAAEMRPNSRFIVLGDMNDGPDSEFLAPLIASGTLNLVNGLEHAQESQPAPHEDPPPPTPLWTERFKPPNQPAEHNLFDQIWLSPALADKLESASIERRKHLGGDGSDHDPAIVTLDL